MKKRHFAFTLLELLVSLFLVGILLTFFFTYFRQSLTVKGQAKVLKEKILKRAACELRLTQIFSRYTKECSLTSLRHPDADGLAVHIKCDMGLDSDPTFCGQLQAMLYKTSDNRLCLCTWSKNNSPRVDTLLDNVKSVSFHFFSGKEWENEWPRQKEDPSFPCMLKISLNQKDEEGRELVFSLPANPQILYEKAL